MVMYVAGLFFGVLYVGEVTGGRVTGFRDSSELRKILRRAEPRRIRGTMTHT